MPTNAPIKSPCVLTCTLDLRHGQCLGCGRSREQIAMWTRYSDAQRDSIMADLRETLAALLAARGEV